MSKSSPHLLALFYQLVRYIFVPHLRPPTRYIYLCTHKTMITILPSNLYNLTSLISLLPQRHPNRPNHQNRLQHHRSLRRHASSPQRPPQNRNPLPSRRNRNLAKQPTNCRPARRQRLLHTHPRSLQWRPTLPQPPRWLRFDGLVDERDGWE